MQLGLIVAVLTAKARPYTRPGTFSAIEKIPQRGPVAVNGAGLEGDEQGDARVHGGPDKAVHLYSWEHYADWRAELGRQSLLGAPGAFGENLSTTGACESQLCLGDELIIGSTRLQITQGRQPCWKLDDRFGLPGMARKVQDSLRTGCYARVLQAGEICAGDAITLVRRHHPEWPLRRLMVLLFQREIDRAELAAALELPLPPNWQRLLRQRLASGKVEDWQARVAGPVRSDCAA